ncbi:RNA 2'-phosphotransferase [Paraglaciecola sp.]|uniref:RNA 2'-phosphotransferase n=1 Tax=Paraglaciecola sp. TaxID=1920173 RepID=UPI003EF81704
MPASSKEIKKASKFLSFILRHCPEDIGLELDNNGWADTSEIIDKSSSQITLTKELIEEVVLTSDKQRFKLSDDGLRIRANQGHSINVNLDLTPSQPPEELYHGTASRFVKSITEEGLKAGQRQHVHLSTDIDTAKSVGQRYGKPVILKVDSKSMFKQGFTFYLSDNNVWLTEHVPAEFLTEL